MTLNNEKMVNKSELRMHRNRDFVEVMPVEPGLIYAYYEATGEVGKDLNLEAGKLQILICSTSDENVLMQGDVNCQDKFGEYWFSSIPQTEGIFAVLKFVSQEGKELILAKSEETNILGKPSFPKGLEWFHLFRQSQQKYYPR